METIYENLIKEYARELDVYKLSFETMGALLDREKVVETLKSQNINSLYIHGGSYIGIQFYKAIKDDIEVLGIVDRSGKTKYRMSGVNTFDMYEFKAKYDGEFVVMTLIQYFSQVNSELSEIVEIDKIRYINEFI